MFRASAKTWHVALAGVSLGTLAVVLFELERRRRRRGTGETKEKAVPEMQPRTGSIVLSNGVRMPSVGLGYWLCPNKEAAEVTKVALSAGVRLLDGAAGYGNEIGIGEGLQAAFTEGVLCREDVFVVSKLFNTRHVWDADSSRVREGFDKTLRDLKLEYLDLFLMHWPFAFQQRDLKGVGPLRLEDGTPNPKLTIKVEFLETYAEMIKLVDEGKVRALGVSNFTQEQLQLLLDKFPMHPPRVLQIEAHPYLTQPELREFCWAKGIHVMAYSPLGAGASYSGKSFPAKGSGLYQNPNAGTTLLANPVVGEISQKLKRSPAQVLIRWSLQSGYVCIPKSARAERIKENFDVLSWSIPEKDMERLNALDCAFRYSIGYSKGHYDCPNAPWSKF